MEVNSVTRKNIKSRENKISEYRCLRKGKKIELCRAKGSSGRKIDLPQVDQVRMEVSAAKNLKVYFLYLTLILIFININPINLKCHKLRT